MKKVFLMRIILLSIALLFLVFVAGCKEDITARGLEGKTVLLSADSIKLDPLQSQDIYLGVNNIYDTDEKFEITIECTVIDCQRYVMAQTFPSIGISAKKMGAFPIRILALEDAIQGTYPFQLTVKHNSEIHGTANLDIEVTAELEQKKKELLEKFN